MELMGNAQGCGTVLADRQNPNELWSAEEVAVNENRVKFSKNELEIGTEVTKLSNPIIEAFESGGKVIVLLDPDAHIEKFGQFRNLIAYDLNGTQLWTAELPTTTSGDTYYRVKSRNPLTADSFSGSTCQVDERSGKITQKTFHK